MFLMLHSINWLNFIVWFPLRLEILGNSSIKIVLNQAMTLTFEINLVFLIKPFWYMTEKPRQKLRYLENEKSFLVEIKSSYHHFSRAFSCQKLSPTWESAFKNSCHLVLSCFITATIIKNTSDLHNKTNNNKLWKMGTIGEEIYNLGD